MKSAREIMSWPIKELKEIIKQLLKVRMNACPMNLTIKPRQEDLRKI
jgi:hypothetical protein